MPHVLSSGTTGYILSTEARFVKLKIDLTGLIIPLFYSYGVCGIMDLRVE